LEYGLGKIGALRHGATQFGANLSLAAEEG
jgi:hypothetical protein